MMSLSHSIPAVGTRPHLGCPKTIGIQFRHRGPSRGVQTLKPEICTVGTQTDITSIILEEQMEEDVQVGSSAMLCHDDWDYAASDASLSSDIGCAEHFTPPSSSTDSNGPRSAVFIISWSSHIQLIDTWCSCPQCGCHSLRWNCTILHLFFICTECGNQSIWCSQPLCSNTPAGNIKLSAAILFAGVSVTKVLCVLAHLGVAIYKVRTYYHHQEQVLFEAVQRVWTERQSWLLSAMQVEEDHSIICGGDSRADSPGHCAKYGTHTLMELQKCAILDIKVVQGDDRELVVSKWKSILQHIQNLHDGFPGLFCQCAHGPLEGREQRKPWLKRGHRPPRSWRRS
ncbi:uncharacterized protein LOC133515148 isoform X2 [Syngnathoides biaculeatus]|uniref:uncharacterized protein LOC133515148 isoform X2 n=1 Tax=Syngnathoides biaculeatus TaxID=300417 RepID=UPI002ADE0933|nr:uncharacterized protein LOC133515148 isoform X2 [Syngnathoides biaculeatus]